MKKALLLKEIKDIFRNKTALIYFIVLFAIIIYSFFSSVDLYSKASNAALDNPLYAAGFEPAPGVFVPTFGGLYIILSLIAPFLLIQSISYEKQHNTLSLLAQFPYPLHFIFISKFLAAIIFLITSIVFFIPTFFFWYCFGGHIPWAEIAALATGYFLYGLIIISISFFSSSVFSNNSQASIFTLAVIMVSWFLDFGKDMNLVPFINAISEWSLTMRLKEFETGIISFQTIVYFILLSSLLLLLTYIFFDFSIKNKNRIILLSILSCLVFSFSLNKVYVKIDISESKRNSFTSEQKQFLKRLPAFEIYIYLEPTDSRYKDYERDFLKKLGMVKNDITLHFTRGKSLADNYGRFIYVFNGKSIETYSNSDHEIFMILEEITGIKIKSSSSENFYKGYPLVVKKNWIMYLIIVYLCIILMQFIIYTTKHKLSTRSKNK